jgi:hypothetical protein
MLSAVTAVPDTATKTIRNTALGNFPILVADYDSYGRCR